MSEPKIFGQDGQYYPLNPFQFYQEGPGAGGIAARVMRFQQRMGNGQPQDEFRDQWMHSFLAEYARMQRLAQEAMAKLHVTLLDHKETAKMAIHNHKSNIPIAETKLVYIDEDIEENQQAFRQTLTFGAADETVLVHSDSESCGSSGRSTPMEMDN